MGLRIATNIASIAVQKHIKDVSASSDKELERLSSGKRITKAGDDAAGLAIAKNLEAQTRSLNQASRNANDGVSMVQTAEGSLNEISNILVRLRELSIQSASDTVGESERGMLNLEYQELSKEVDRISASTEFNGVHLLDGQGKGVLDFHVGSKGGDQNIIKYDSGQTNASASSIGISGTDVTSKSSALSSVSAIDGAINAVSGQRASLGAIQNRLQHSASTLDVQSVNQEHARSVIEDTDIANSAAQLASSTIVKSAGIAALAQANMIPNSALKLI
ncbi:MAG: flagellin [Bdellovibrionales bacterium GWA2_49_15]|nr:MAG: flagellin [Bdellovibrionales bacterium GWA2_49_15]